MGLGPSCSTVRPRRPFKIPAPVLQAGIVECEPIENYAQSEVSLTYLPNAIATRTGAVIFNDQYLIEETLEGTPAQNGLIEEFW